MDSPPSRPKVVEGTLLQISNDVRIDCRGTFEQVERYKEEPQPPSAFDTAVLTARRCIENGIEPPGGPTSLGLSSEDFEKAKENVDARSKKGKLPGSGGVSGGTLLTLGAGALVLVGLLVRKMVR